jgi:hypothetical protein
VQDKEIEAADGPVGPDPTGASLAAFPRRNRDLFHYLITTFISMLPAEKAAQFTAIAAQLERSIQDNCQVCRISHQQAGATVAQAPRDPRRSRFLLRLVVSKVSYLFASNKPVLPRTIIEALDTYLKKAFGAVIYDELNEDADRLLYQLNSDDDTEMWEIIRANREWRRFVDTIFIRILFRFENFPAGKKTFITIIDTVMQEHARFTFSDDHFLTVFEALFSELWEGLEKEDQRIRWDFNFGDGTSKRLQTILKQGLARWIKKRDTKVLGSGRVVPK